MAHIKGTAWIGMNEYFQKLGGPEGIRKVMDSLSEADRAVLSKPILPVTWVDYQAYMNYVLAADRILGKGDFETAKAAALHNARKGLNGPYKIFISIATPKFVVGGVLRFWRQYFDRGTMQAHWQGERNGRLEITDFPDIPLHHEICNTPHMEEALRICGCKNVRFVHTRCIARGDASCIFEASWE